MSQCHAFVPARECHVRRVLDFNRDRDPYTDNLPLVNMAGKFWFPAMENEEITIELSARGLTVSIEQLTRPSSDFVITIYNACLEQVTSLDYEALRGPTQDAMNSLEDPNPVCRPSYLIDIVLIDRCRSFTPSVCHRTSYCTTCTFNQ